MKFAFGVVMGLLTGGVVFLGTDCREKQSSKGLLFGAFENVSVEVITSLITSNALFGERTSTTIRSVILMLPTDFIIPLSMFLSHYVSFKGSFTAWTVNIFIGVFYSLAILAVWRIWEAKAFCIDF
ncbi:hypothetical protein ONS96_009017 [Cadophora gregata f. sp. sojae]|nr:hypothetical protein ONS96_009017 [Cadophora gregata f. sp. sojae]